MESIENVNRLKYCSETNRLKSFENYKPANWNFTEQMKQNYARAGFYSTGADEEVKCYFCHFKMVRLLEDEVDPFKLHCRYNSTCPFICRYPTDNIPIDEELLKLCLPPAPEFVGSVPRAKYSDYSTTESRLESFRRWPSKHCIIADDLVAAGFFYMGYSDVVCCYFCGLVLSEFELGEKPLDSHKKFRSGCGYVNNIPASEPAGPANFGISVAVGVGVAVGVSVLLMYKFRPKHSIIQYGKFFIKTFVLGYRIGRNTEYFYSRVGGIFNKYR